MIVDTVYTTIGPLSCLSIAWLFLLLVSLVFLAFAKNHEPLARAVWALAVLLLPILGPLAYFIIAKPSLRIKKS